MPTNLRVAQQLFVRINRRLSRLVWRLTIPPVVRACGMQFPNSVRFDGWPIVEVGDGAAIELGDEVVLCSNSRYTALGVNHPVILRALLPGARLQIGRQSGISGASICCARAVTIGEQCLIGANAVICDTDFHPVKSLSRRFAPLSEAGAAPVHIGDRVFIGTGAIILKGVTIGDDAVVGAGAVVRTDVPARAIVTGNPMTIVGSFYKEGGHGPVARST